MQTKNLSILMTDIQGFTARTSEATRHDIASFAASHEKLLYPVFKHFKGKVIKTLGDAFMVCFDSPTDAVLCGLTIQEVLKQHNSNADEKQQLSIRVAINSGDVNLLEDDIMGEPVNIVARLESITEAGEVWFTEAVYLTMNRQEVPSAEVGEKVFKGIPYPIKVYKVIHDPNSTQAKEIAASVQWTDQGPTLSKPTLSTSAKEEKSSPLKFIAFLVVLGAALSSFFLLDTDKANIVRLNKMEEYQQAWELSVLYLSENPTEEEVRALAPQIAEKLIQNMLQKNELQKALNWLKQHLEEHAYLEPLQALYDHLETKQAFEDFLKTQPFEREMWSWIREQLKKHPKHSDIPFTLAERLKGKHVIETILWLYEESILRGKPANEVQAWDHCKITFERNALNSPEVMSANNLSQHYPKERSAWMNAHLESDDSNKKAIAQWLQQQEQKKQGAAPKEPPLINKN